MPHHIRLVAVDIINYIILINAGHPFGTFQNFIKIPGNTSNGANFDPTALITGIPTEDF